MDPCQRCFLGRNQWVQVQGAPGRSANFFQVNTRGFAINPANGQKCGFSSGYIYAGHVAVYNNGQMTHGPAARSGTGALGAKGICQKSWEQSPGTTDYTTFDSYHGKTFSSPDRQASQTLQGSSILRRDSSITSLCHNAQVLKGCFAESLERDRQDPLRGPWLSWARSQGIDALRFRLAISFQETWLGGYEDSCSGSSCSGVGIGQVITLIDDHGNEYNPGDQGYSNHSAWNGITFNVLTNLKYSARVLASKVNGSDLSFHAAAQLYNGSSTAVEYAERVHHYYSQLKSSCGMP